VASGDVQQEKKIKTAGLESGVPLEKMPAGCQRSLKYNFLYDSIRRLKAATFLSTRSVFRSALCQQRF
jgi:hypothetical protein